MYTWRKIQKLGLVNECNENEDLQWICGELDGLAILPIDEVPEGIAHLTDNAPPAAMDLILYFDKM